MTLNLIFKPHILDKLRDKHRVTQEEVEEAAEDPHRYVRRHTKGRSGAQRFLVIGQTGSGRYLRMVVETSYDGFIVISAYDAPEQDRRQHRRR